MTQRRVEWAPGCFDDFDGTQEELTELMAELQRMADAGELDHLCQQVDLDDLSDEEQELLQRLDLPVRVLH